MQIKNKLTTKQRCEARTRDGRPCGATPMVRKRGGKYLCLFHCSNFAAELGRKGGRHRANMNLNELVQYDPPLSPEDLLPILSSTIVEIRGGKIDSRTVQALVSATGAFLNVVEVADLDKRLKALEKKNRA